MDATVPEHCVGKRAEGILWKELSSEWQQPKEERKKCGWQKLTVSFPRLSRIQVLVQA